MEIRVKNQDFLPGEFVIMLKFAFIDRMEKIN